MKPEGKSPTAPTVQFPLIPLIQAIDKIATDPITKLFLYATLGAALVHMAKAGMIIMDKEAK